MKILNSVLILELWDKVNGIESNSGETEITTTPDAYSMSIQSLTHHPRCRTYASVNWAPLVQVMACRLFGAKPLPESIIINLDP